jgi:hypothetical protein
MNAHRKAKESSENHENSRDYAPITYTIFVCALRHNFTANLRKSGLVYLGFGILQSRDLGRTTIAQVRANATLEESVKIGAGCKPHLAHSDCTIVISLARLQRA